MAESFTKNTQNTLGKIINKPFLTEKLLSRPPFRYLHDIIVQVIHTTGFMKGLYDEAEMYSKNVKDKDAKIAFLQKAIDVVALVSEEEISVKPKRIVAGLEPEETNKLLQAIAKCCLNKFSSDEAVKCVLAGVKGMSYDAEKKEDPDHHREVRHEREMTVEQGKKKVLEKERKRDKEWDRILQDEKKEKNKEQDAQNEKGCEQDMRKQELELECHRERKEKANKKVRVVEKLSRQMSCPEESEETHKMEGKSGSPDSIPLPSSHTEDRCWPKPGSPVCESSSLGKTAHYENEDGTDILPIQACRSNRKTPRPTSARPAPPRLKKHESYIYTGPVERPGSAKPPSSIPVDDKEEDLEEQYVLEDAAMASHDMPELELDPSVELEGDEKHGGLVKKILETKKDFESSSLLISKDQDQINQLVLEATRTKERELAHMEINQLCSCLQNVCTNVQPMAKIINYLQEDIVSIQNELPTWKKKNEAYEQTLLQEQRITESVMDPLNAELAELEQFIKDEQEKICTVKTKVFDNQKRIMVQRQLFFMNMTVEH